jgi:cysteine desulfurase
MFATAMPIYLDYNATAPLRPAAIEAMTAALGVPFNPSSVHKFGREARLQVETARQKIAHLIGGRSDELTFTSGGTEANNLVLSGFNTVIASRIEHDAVLDARRDALLVDVDERGVIKLDMLGKMLSDLSAEDKKSVLVSVMAANNETGVRQPLQAITALCHQHGVAVHSDMVQLAGKYRVSLAEFDLDFATISAHKIGGPAGVGALWCKAGRRLPAIIRGGGQEKGMRSGTENVIGIIGFGAAADAAASEIEADEISRNLAKWHAAFEQTIRAACPEISILGDGADRLFNTSCLALPQIASQTAIMALDLDGVMVSAGSACSSGKVSASHVITAMGRDDLAPYTLRISSGWQTREEDLATLAKAIIGLYKRLS